MLTITLKTHQLQKPPVGFNKQSLTIPYVKFGENLRTVIANLNQYRGPDSQINKIYNSLGQEIPQVLWGMKIKENMIFYIDCPLA